MRRTVGQLSSVAFGESARAEKIEEGLQDRSSVSEEGLQDRSS
jgi:hypothetical protein